MQYSDIFFQLHSWFLNKILSIALLNDLPTESADYQCDKNGLLISQFPMFSQLIGHHYCEGTHKVQYIYALTYLFSLMVNDTVKLMIKITVLPYLVVYSHDMIDEWE